MKSSQIIAGAIALFAFGGAFVLMNRSKPVQPVVVRTAPPVERTDLEHVLVASKDIPLGTQLQEIDMVWSPWPRVNTGEGMILRSREPKAMEDIAGSIARGQFFKGEPLRQSKLVKGPNAGFLSAILPSGSRAVAINIDSTGSTSAGGFILPNDRVDVIRTIRAGQGENGYASQTILRNIRVLAIGQRIEEKNNERVVVGSNATLELTPRQSEQIVLAQRVGQLSLVLRSMFDANADATDKPESEDQEQASALSIVRFGITTNVNRR
jgi:pilus assembly protein CpaB